MECFSSHLTDHASKQSIWDHTAITATALAIATIITLFGGYSVYLLTQVATRVSSRP